MLSSFASPREAWNFAKEDIKEDGLAWEDFGDGPEPSSSEEWVESFNESSTGDGGPSYHVEKVAVKTA